MSRESSSSHMDEAALFWATRLDGGLTPSEHDELTSWLQENPAHEWRLAHFRHFFARLHGTVPLLVTEGRIAPVTAAAPRPRHSLRRWTGGLAAAAALILGFFWFTHRPEEFNTLAAQRQHITFADGSHADLNAHTSLAIRLRDRDRRVRLDRGEAYFEVAKDPARPFYIETAHGEVRVTGTKFNGRTDPAGLLEVTVLEGSVAVSPGNDARARSGAAPLQLKPRDQVTVDGGHAAGQQLTAAAAENVIAWRDGKVVFDDTPLAVAAERFAAYHDRTITVAPTAAGLLLGDRYTLDDFDQFLGSLEKTLPVKALRAEDGSVRLVAVPRPQ